MAIATPAGEGAVGVVRVSGPNAVTVVQPLVGTSTVLAALPPRRLTRVALIDPRTGSAVDDALCAVMPGPASYTGEDVVELSCHGSPALLRLVVERIIESGARLAEPGEFTRRAFLNGRIDLVQAEAVALLVGARTERAVTLAARALAGGLSERLRGVHEALLDVVSGLEVTLDFPDEHVGLDVEGAIKAVTGLADDVGRLLAAARRERLVYEGLTVALVGPPNAGKSSLLNALLGRDRAIVSPEPGTTRDIVEGGLVVDGIAVRLLDTAGLGAAQDTIDAEGMRRTRLAIAESDLLLVIQDGSVPVDVTVLAETAGHARVLVQAKSDLGGHPSHQALEAVAVSALTGEGLDRLLAAIGHAVRVDAEIHGDEIAVVTSLRQTELLDALHRALEQGADALVNSPLEAALVDLREAMSIVSGMLGLTIDNAVLDRIFATFCLGK